MRVKNAGKSSINLPNGVIINPGEVGQCSRHPAVTGLIKAGLLDELETVVLPQEPAAREQVSASPAPAAAPPVEPDPEPAPDPEADTDDEIPINITTLTVAEAVPLVSKVEDTDLLETWVKADSRKTVKKAVLRRLRELRGD